MRAALCALTLLVAVPAAAEPILPEVDALVEPLVGVDTPGLAVLVMRDGEVLHRAGYGLADIETEEPVTPRTIFDLASVSKQMTALAAALLETEGAFAVYTPVADIVEALADMPEGSNRAVSVYDLVYHTSGLADYLSGDEALAFDETTTNADVLAWLAEQPLEADPGTVFSYSNTGYLVLASVVAAADGRDSFAEALAARVFEPLGMEDSAVARPADPSLRATGYAGTDGAFEESAWGTSVEGDGSVFTNLDDLARYEAALAGGAFGPRVMEIVFSGGILDDNAPIEDENGDDYGWGWSLTSDVDGDQIAVHGGSWAGTAAVYRRNLGTGLTVIVLANGEDFGPYALAEEIASALDG